MKIKYCLLAICFFVSQSFAQTSTTTTDTTQTQAQPTQSSGLTNASGSSKSGSALAVIGEGMTAITGVDQATQCHPTADGAIHCVMAALCAAQLIATLASQKGADGVNAAYTPGSGAGAAGTGTDLSSLDGGSSAGSGSSAGTSASGASTNPSGFASQLATINSALSKAGFATGTDANGNPTITTPNGTTIPANPSSSDLTAAGIDPADMTSALADIKSKEAMVAAKAAALAKDMGYQSMGGGGGITAHAENPNATMGGAGIGLANANRKPTAFAKQSVAGLSRKLGDENIGVKGDNIFEMINRRYRAQDQQNAFLKEK